MSNTQRAPLPFSNPRFFSVGDCERLEQQLKDDLLLLPHIDQSTRQKKKDIKARKNRAPETLASLLVGAYRKEQSVEKVTRIARTIIGFFAPNTHRCLGDLNAIETKEEGDLNNVQMAIAQGDHSTPVLRKGVDEIDEIVPVLLEMRSAMADEINARTSQ